jgi:dihydroorotate dehydrogenase (NAD+) catalytic subunit
MPDLSIALGSLRIRTPLMLASGAVGYGTEYRGVIDLDAVGAVVTKTVTLEPRAGNDPPRLAETTGGLLNAIGLENVGLRTFLDEKLPGAAALGAPVVASVGGPTPEEFGRLAGEIGARDEAAAIELNVSCPNIERPRTPLWADAPAVGAVVAAARRATPKPILVKLSPATADIVPVAEAAEDGGADALVVANTLPGMRVDTERGRPRLGNVTGGLSGPALLPVNLALVYRAAGAVSIPIVGSGGIASAGDALEYLMAGASAFQVGTALFADPSAPSAIIAGLVTRMERDGRASVADYVGLARRAGT